MINKNVTSDLTEDERLLIFGEDDATKSAIEWIEAIKEKRLIAPKVDSKPNITKKAILREAIRKIREIEAIEKKNNEQYKFFPEINELLLQYKDNTNFIEKVREWVEGIDHGYFEEYIMETSKEIEAGYFNDWFEWTKEECILIIEWIQEVAAKRLTKNGFDEKIQTQGENTAS